MARAAEHGDWASWFTDASAFLISAVCHLAGMIALGLLAISIQRGSEIALRVTPADQLVDAAGDDSWVNDGIEISADQAAAAALGPARLFERSSLSAADLAAAEAPLDLATQASGFEGTAFGNFGEGGDGRLRVVSEFFGIGGYGRSFVYVVDCSGSMSEDGKFWRAVYELMRSIESLDDDQEYYVIFYNHQAYPMESDGAIAATEENVEQTRDWVNLVVPQGGTRPLSALLTALALKPDAVYFLSDGRFDPGTSAQVRAKNRPKEGRRIPIHTVAFVNRETQGLMRRIARGSGGEYRFVE